MTWRKGRPFRTLRSILRLTGPRTVVPFLLVIALALPFAWRAPSALVGEDDRIDVAANVRADNGAHLVNVRIDPVLVQRVIDTVEDGLRAQVTFFIRHYGPSEDFGGFLGETLIEELSVSRTLSYDPFTGEYLIDDSRGHESRHDTVVTAVRDLYQVSDVEVADDRHDPEYFSSRAGEVRARAVVTPMVVADPVFLAAPLLGDGMSSSRWVRVAAEDPGVLDPEASEGKR
ncbi:MAG: DUF4390 domain-containing protein [Spirochaetales bacterium]